MLRSIADTFETSDAELCYGDLVDVNDDNKIVRYWQSSEYRLRKFYYEWVPPHPTVFVRREI